MILFDRIFCKIYFHESIRAVHLDWNKHASREQFIEACDFSLSVLEETKSIKMIADNSKVTVVAVENQNWLTEVWFPKALEKGFQYSAVILSNDVFVKFAVKRIENNVNNKLFVIQYFEDLALAKEWLASVD